jgi:hypothetical protein
MKNFSSVVVGFAFLVVLLSAGAAQSLSGTNTVDSGDIKNGTIVGADVSDNSLTGTDIKTGRANYWEDWEIDPDAYQGASADCPSGKHVSGGGFAQAAGLLITDSYAEDSNTWVVFAQNTTSETVPLSVLAICDGL